MIISVRNPISLFFLTNVFRQRTKKPNKKKNIKRHSDGPLTKVERTGKNRNGLGGYTILLKTKTVTYKKENLKRETNDICPSGLDVNHRLWKRHLLNMGMGNYVSPERGGRRTRILGHLLFYVLKPRLS